GGAARHDIASRAIHQAKGGLRHVPRPANGIGPGWTLPSAAPSTIPRALRPRGLQQREPTGLETAAHNGAAGLARERAEREIPSVPTSQSVTTGSTGVSVRHRGGARNFSRHRPPWPTFCLGNLGPSLTNGQEQRYFRFRQISILEQFG